MKTSQFILMIHLFSMTDMTQNKNNRTQKDYIHKIDNRFPICGYNQTTLTGCLQLGSTVTVITN